MGALVGMLVGKTIFGRVISEPVARFLVGLGLFIAALAVVGLGKVMYDRAVIAHHNLKADAKLVKAERKADTNLVQQKVADDAAAAARKQEITDATRNIPDQAPSARQRARVCIELRRQHEKLPASCGPQPAS
jgi:hypothetical protein